MSNDFKFMFPKIIKSGIFINSFLQIRYVSLILNFQWRPVVPGARRKLTAPKRRFRPNMQRQSKEDFETREELGGVGMFLNGGVEGKKVEKLLSVCSTQICSVEEEDHNIFFFF